MHVMQDIAANTGRYDFVQAMRYLLQLQSHSEQKISIQLKAEAMPIGDGDEIQHFSLKGNKAKLRLAKQALFGSQGVIPNYIYEELLAALHNEDHALKDFLDVFNQRYFEIDYRVESQKWLLLEKEQNHQKFELLNHLSALHTQHRAYFQYSFLLGQQSRSLSSIKQILNDYFPYSIDVTCQLHQRKKLPHNSLTRIGTREEFNSRAGKGFLLGKTCLAQFNHLNISITPASRSEFKQIEQDVYLGQTMMDIVQHYLRDNTSVSIYLNVKRAYLQRPTLSSSAQIAAKLGEVDCMAPERKPEQSVRILLR
ncbi:type VI secretion system baseplate subunit TssG [Vibrio sp. NTOU-M3]|uniref:type VI secretion system baseplate subunit TssG n=1 Tax=Vibrio sp. NTOU-M3 TaxID=3234954 RepID=UPI00349FA24A